MAIVSAVTEGAFADRRGPDWQELEGIVSLARHRGVRALTQEQLARFAPLYRDLCADLARAKAARYAAPLLDYLQALTVSSHAVLYDRIKEGAFAGVGSGARLRVAVEAFPRAVRRHAGAMILSWLLFFVPFFFGLLATMSDPSFATRVAPESMLRPLTEAYREGFEAGRPAGLDVLMAGFYVQHNISIALTCFALGLFLGLGSAVYLVFNGLSTGAIMGYVAAHGAGENIFTFVVGHSSLELGAIVLCGGAGLVVGWSIVSPGAKSRAVSLQDSAREMIVIVFGAAVMLAAAAAVEGFWSASSMPSGIKRATGAVLFLVLLGYVLLAGRRSEQAAAFERGQGSAR